MTDAVLSRFEPLSDDAARHDQARERLDRLAWALDSAIRLPGTDIRLGADALLNLIPGIGNVATTALSAWLIREAWRLGASRRTLARMAGNVALDGLISSVPLAGSVADVFWKANRRNMAILNRHLDEKAARRSGKGARHRA